MRKEHALASQKRSSFVIGGTMKRKQFTLLCVLMLTTYLAAPIAAGIFEIGDKWGPRLYSTKVHSDLYYLGWSMTSHRDNKPRIGVLYKPELRPWFYGMKSDNEVLLLLQP